MNRQYRETPVQNTALIYQNELIPSLSGQYRETPVQNTALSYPNELIPSSSRQYRETPVQNTALIYQNELIPSSSLFVDMNKKWPEFLARGRSNDLAFAYLGNAHNLVVYHICPGL